MIATGIGLIRKIQRHDAACTSRPPPSGPITVATPVHAVQVPIAAARSPSPNVSRISASELGTSRAPATPCTPRAAIRTSLLGASAHTSEHTPKPIRPAWNTRRRPSTSPSDPPSNSSDDSVSR